MSMVFGETKRIDDDGYDDFIRKVNDRLRMSMEAGQVFTTSSTGLWEAYLNGIPEDRRQHYNCRSCRKFIETYGGLVKIDENGIAKSAVWDASDAPSYMVNSVVRLLSVVNSAIVTGVFFSDLSIYGYPVTGEWRHLCCIPPTSAKFVHTLLTPFQAAAEKSEDFKNVSNALDLYDMGAMKLVLQVLNSDELYRREKVLAAGEWLHELKEMTDSVGFKTKRNLIWKAVACAPAGFCHPRSSMIGTLLDDVLSGMPFADVSRRFSDKMHPLKYQRPQAAPNQGAIVAAEKAFEKLGAARSLERRLARPDEIQKLWIPDQQTSVKKPGGGIFSHLKPSAPQVLDMNVPAESITWVKFRRDVLSSAKSIDVLIPSGNSPFLIWTTAVHDDAPPILQWDLPEKRCPLSMYSWMSSNGVNGSPPSQHGLVSGWNAVSSVALPPWMWHDENAFQNQPRGAYFILRSAYETESLGSAIFPELLKTEFHSMRSVIEAYSKTKDLDLNCVPHTVSLGLGVKSGGRTVRVVNNLGTKVYKIDRWE